MGIAYLVPSHHSRLRIKDGTHLGEGIEVVGREIDAESIGGDSFAQACGSVYPSCIFLFTHVRSILEESIVDDKVFEPISNCGRG